MSQQNRHTNGVQITLRLSQTERERIRKVGEAVRKSQPLATDSDVIRELLGLTVFGWITDDMRSWLAPDEQSRPTHKVVG